MTPPGLRFKVEVIVGVPLAEIATGTLVLEKMEQTLVVKVYTVDHEVLPQKLFARTRQ